MGGLAEFKHDLIRERTHAGLEAVRVRGRKEGRPVNGGPGSLAPL
jgi:DNA invertase Pin-like site-specific DNA recombinase